MSTRSSIPDAVDTDRTAGAIELLEPPREAVEWMASPAPATDLWWTATVCGEADPDWHRLETTVAETIEVLVSWAQGHGLPLPYGAALRTYGNPPDPGLVT